MGKFSYSRSFLFVFMMIISIGFMSCATHDTQTAINCDEHLITVLNPAISSDFAERVPLTPRTGSLEGKTIMRAVAYETFGGPLTVQTFPDPSPPDDGVVIAVHANGICRSDWHGWIGHDPDEAGAQAPHPGNGPLQLLHVGLEIRADGPRPVGDR